jgi:hypothetical protein
MVGLVQLLEPRAHVPEPDAIVTGVAHARAVVADLDAQPISLAVGIELDLPALRQGSLPPGVMLTLLIVLSAPAPS